MIEEVRLLGLANPKRKINAKEEEELTLISVHIYDELTACQGPC